MSKIERIKNHVRENKKVYIVGASCLAVGAMGGGLYVATRPEVTQMVKMQNIGLTWKPKQEVIQFIERSTPSKPIHLKGTQQYFDSISSAARETGLDRSRISKQLAGLVDDVQGNVFELVDTIE